MKRKIFGFIFFICFFSTLSIYAEEGPRVEIFTPQGTVKKVREVQVRFSEQMVPFGDPRGLTEPFEMDCPEKGTARWGDGKNWIYDFERDLPAGIRCEFRLKPGLKTLAGKEIGGQKVFSFSTGGPAIKASAPPEGAKSIDEEQVFILTLDAEPAQESVLQNVFFSIEGIQDRVGIRILTGKEKERILKARYRFRKPPEQTMLLIQSKQRFPARAKVCLVWGKGVVSKTGVTTTQDQVLPFQARKGFTVEFHCRRESPRAACIPITPMRLNFSAPISMDQAHKILLKGPGEKAWHPRFEEEIGSRFLSHVTFQGPFPENANFTLQLPSRLRDDAGRSLINADKFPLNVRTDRYPPLAKFSSRFGILELKADPVLPVTLRSLEPRAKVRIMKAGQDEIAGTVTGKILNLPPARGADVQAWLRKVASASRETSILRGEKGVKDVQVPKIGGARAIEVVGIPLKDPGLYVVELESALLGKALLSQPGPMFVPTAALVTNLSVHFKWGRESSLVWVTALDTGEPVRDAVVTVKDCREKVLWKGQTDGEGVARIETALPSRAELPRCNYVADRYDAAQMSALNSLESGLFIMAQTAEDMAFVHSSWDEGIEPWRFQLPEEDYPAQIIGHTIFDRTLLRAGQTLHMKHILRQHTTRGFSLAPKTQTPNFVSLDHVGSGQKYEFALQWDAKGIAETTWSIPREAKLGTYEVVLRQKSDAKGKEPAQAWASGRVRVEEFRVPLLRGVIQPPVAPLINAREVTLDLNVQYLAGGGAGHLPVKLRGEVRPKGISPLAGFDHFLFSNGPVKEGVIRRGEDLEEEGEGEEPVDERRGVKLPSIDLVLDRSGSARTTLANLPKVDFPKEILAELEFKDPNGEGQTISSRIPLWGSKYLIGIKPDSWAASKDGLKFQVAVVDLSGKPVAGVQVNAVLFQRETLSHRKRTVGGFYSYEHSVETKKIGALCTGRTDTQGLLICEARSPVSGNVIIQVESLDDAGGRAVAQCDVWVAAKKDWWFGVGDHDRIDLLPEKRRYEPGEIAVFQVRMPFREATALICVEREGVIEAWVKKISGKSPVIEVPIKGSYAPNVFVSVLPVRGRVAEVKPTAMVDLGRPAYKLGIAEISVGWKKHELQVAVSTDRQVYKVCQKAQVRIQVRTSDGKTPPPGSEVAVAAVDEGLLELMDNPSWGVLRAMMGRRGYGIQTSTAQAQVIGKRHFGLKALQQGGGGGRQITRELFDTLLLWKARLPLDPDGEASVEVPLNDSITSFRIVAVATGGVGLFGTGSTSIQSTQDLMILSGLPPLVREGDLFQAEFTLRNTTNRNMEVDVSARVERITESPKPMTLSLVPGEAREIGWEAMVPGGVENLRWEVEAQEKGSPEKDRIRVTQRVIPAIPVRTFQATIAQIRGDFRVRVERPEDALPGRGGLRVTMRPKIADGLGGVTDYMKKYPYGCLEQKISMAVALRDENLWKGLISQLPSYLDSDGLVKYFPTMTHGSETLTSYIVAIAHEAGWAISDEIREKMEGGLRRFIEGSIFRSTSLPTADLSIRKLSAAEALSRGSKFEARLLSSISIEPNLWPTSAVIDWLNILQNSKTLPHREERLKEAEHILRSRLNLQGETMTFSTEKSDALWWLMVSNDGNAVRAILSLLGLEEWKEDLPRLVQGALARQKRGAWDLTLANAWGVLAMEKFSKAFEAIPVSGTTRAALATQSQAVDWNGFPQGKIYSFPWPAKREEMSISHEGNGQPWASIQSLAAIPLNKPFSSGYRIQKTITPTQQKDPRAWSRGDILRIRLEIEAEADQTWVVVEDPIPAGSTILGTGLGRDSEILTRGEKREGWVWPAYEERSFEVFRAYYEYVTKGKWAVEYTLRLNQSGLFLLPATRTEALYFPEMIGEIPNQNIKVLP
jgi:uncharacterized protein YfaS (alpha-2-macroglobulin family)